MKPLPKRVKKPTDLKQKLEFHYHSCQVSKKNKKIATHSHEHPVVNGPLEIPGEREIAVDLKIAIEIFSKDGETNEYILGLGAIGVSQFIVLAELLFRQAATFFHVVADLSADLAGTRRVRLEFFSDDGEVGLVGGEACERRNKGEEMIVLSFRRKIEL